VAHKLIFVLVVGQRLRFYYNGHARRSLSTVGGHTVANQPPTAVLISFAFIPPAERCKVSQQVWNRVMSWTWTCVSSTVTFLI